MALFDLFKRQPAPPADLREALIDAAAREDWEKLAGLCERHADEIREAFPGWKKVPDAVRKDPAAQARYAQGLIAVAQVFEQGGDGSLIAALMGTPADNPLATWERALATAQSLLEQEQPKEAAELLRSVLERNKALQGTAVASYLARTHGLLGVALFRAGDQAAGILSTRRARDLCVEAKDSDGATVYTGNLRRMEGGPSVVFRDPSGDAVDPADLAGKGGTFRYEVTGGGHVPPAAQELHEQARRAGGSGDYAGAMALLKQAVTLAPDWAYPVYDMAYTHLLLEEPDSAIACYRRTLELSPRGFFSAITALDTLEREKSGDLPAGLLLAYLSLEHIEDRAEKAAAARLLVDKVPGFAPAWKDMALATDQPAERLAAIRKGLAASPDAETRGMLKINEALVLHGQGDGAPAVRLLEALVEDTASTLATEQLARAALAALTAESKKRD